MKKIHKNITLGDLILAVGAHNRNNRKTVAAVADLLGSSHARLHAGNRIVRAQVL